MGPGYEIEVDKTHLKDDYVKVNEGRADETTEVYSQWEIKFDRNRGFERALVEDTLPHYKIDGKIYTDTFVENAHNRNADKEDYGWEVVEVQADGTEVPWTPRDITVAASGEGGQNTTEHVAGSTQGETCVPKLSLDKYDIVFWFYTKYTDKNHDAIDHPGVADPNIEGLTKDQNVQDNAIIIRFWTKNDKTWIDKTAEGKAPNEHWNYVHLVLDGKEAVDKAYGVPKPETKLEKRYEEVGSWTQDLGNGLKLTLPVYRYTLTLNGVTDETFVQGTDGQLQLTVSDEYNDILQYLPASKLHEATNNPAKKGNITLDNNKTYVVSLKNWSDTDERLVRTLPVSVDPSSDSGTDASSTTITRASWSINQPIKIGQEINRTEINKNTGEYETVPVRPITIRANKADNMQFEVKDENGNILYENGDQTKPVKVYGKSYEVSYYLAPDREKVRQRAQDMVDPPRDYENTSIALTNVATWTSTDGEAIANEAKVDFDYPLNPVEKTLLSYDSSTETDF